MRTEGGVSARLFSCAVAGQRLGPHMAYIPFSSITYASIHLPTWSLHSMRWPFRSLLCPRKTRLPGAARRGLSMGTHSSHLVCQ